MAVLLLAIGLSHVWLGSLACSSESTPLSAVIGEEQPPKPASRSASSSR